MKALLSAGRQAAGPGQATGPAYYIHPGDLSWWLYYSLRGHDWSQIIHLWEDEDGRLAAWVLLTPGAGYFDLYVRPDWRQAGPLESLLAWVDAAAEAMVRPVGGQAIRTMWIDERDRLFISLLEQRGYSLDSEYLLCLEQPLAGPVDAPQLPDGFTVRSVAGEHEAALRAAASHAAFGSSRPFDVYLQNYLAFMRSPVYTPDLDLVTVAPDGRFASFCICWVDDASRVGLFEPVGTHPDFRGRGLGRAVMQEGLRRLQARGMAQAVVCAQGDNPAAQRLYESAGFRVALRLLGFSRPL
jgi:ribosomal protein S18 acetylase RimI-like enzyme